MVGMRRLHATSTPPRSRRFRLPALALLAALIVVATPVGTATLAAQDTAQATDAATMQRGRQLTQQFYDGDISAVVAALDDRMRAEVGGADGLRAFRAQVMAQLGDEVDVLDERVGLSGEHAVYQRTARFTNYTGTVIVAWSFAADGRAAGFVVRPDRTSAHDP
jgi:hypothetical protein